MKQELQNTKIAAWTKKWAKKQNLKYVFYEQTTSTNDKAKEYFFGKAGHAADLSENFSSFIIKKESAASQKNRTIKVQSFTPLIFITESQTKGRGRRNRHWFNSDLMISWSYIIQQAPQPVMTDLMGKALYTALKNSWNNCPFKIKKPNDIYIKSKKLAGLLIEVVNKGDTHQLVIGVGINIFSHPLSGPFTHLQEHIKNEITERKWNLFLDEWYKQIRSVLELSFARK